MDVRELLAEGDVPEFYVDSVRAAISAYGFTLELGVQGLRDTPASEPPPIKRVALVRMSPQHALVLARLLEKNVRLYEEKIGPIVLPPQLFKDLNLE
jgi:hypothetical protein